MWLSLSFEFPFSGSGLGSNLDEDYQHVVVSMSNLLSWSDLMYIRRLLLFLFCFMFDISFNIYHLVRNKILDAGPFSRISSLCHRC